MLAMLADPALSDVSLVVEGVEVPAHKAVLGEGVSLGIVKKTGGLRCQNLFAPQSTSRTD